MVSITDTMKHLLLKTLIILFGSLIAQSSHLHFTYLRWDLFIGTSWIHLYNDFRIFRAYIILDFSLMSIRVFFATHTHTPINYGGNKNIQVYCSFLVYCGCEFIAFISVVETDRVSSSSKFFRLGSFTLISSIRNARLSVGRSSSFVSNYFFTSDSDIVLRRSRYSFR